MLEFVTYFKFHSKESPTAGSLELSLTKRHYMPVYPHPCPQSISVSMQHFTSIYCNIISLGVYMTLLWEQHCDWSNGKAFVINTTYVVCMGVLPYYGDKYCFRELIYIMSSALPPKRLCSLRHCLERRKMCMCVCVCVCQRRRAWGRGGGPNI